MSEEGSAALPARVTVSPEILFQDIADEVVLLNPQNEHYYGLDAVGARAWHLLKDQTDPSQVLSQLLNEYDVEECVLRRDLGRLLQELAAGGLVTFDEAG